MFGVLALLILVWITLGRVFARQPALSKAIVLSLTVWALLFMYHAATRLAAPGFIFGMAAATFLIEVDSQDRPSMEGSHPHSFTN
jgi:cell division protein FtsW (lipid II flippase)